MNTCVISSFGNIVICQFGNIIDKGIVLVFTNGERYISYHTIQHTNSLKIKLPDSGGKFRFRIYFDDTSIEKSITMKKQILSN